MTWKRPMMRSGSVGWKVKRVMCRYDVWRQTNIPFGFGSRIFRLYVVIIYFLSFPVSDGGFFLISRITVHLRNSRVTMHMFCTKNFSYSIFFTSSWLVLYLFWARRAASLLYFEIFWVKHLALEGNETWRHWTMGTDICVPHFNLALASGWIQSACVVSRLDRCLMARRLFLFSFRFSRFCMLCLLCSQSHVLGCNLGMVVCWSLVWSDPTMGVSTALCCLLWSCPYDVDVWSMLNRSGL